MRTLSLVLASSLSLLAVHSPAHANLGSGMIANKIMQHLDTNKNGLIELTEMQQRWQQRFNQHDSDTNQALSWDEFEAMLQALRAQAPRWQRRNHNAPEQAFQHLDKNQDQQVSLDEYMTQKTTGFQHLDKNADAALSLDELKAARGQFQALR